jgi:hypothetical protein
MFFLSRPAPFSEFLLRLASFRSQCSPLLLSVATGVGPFAIVSGSTPARAIADRLPASRALRRNRVPPRLLSPIIVSVVDPEALRLSSAERLADDVWLTMPQSALWWRGAESIVGSMHEGLFESLGRAGGLRWSCWPWSPRSPS